jgi:hypothetical protein
MIAFTLSLTSVVYFLLALCVIAILVVGVRWLLAQMGVTIPNPILAILGFMLFLLVLLWFMGVIGGGSAVVIR